MKSVLTPAPGCMNYELIWIRLRDLLTEKEQEHRIRLSELEKDTTGYTDLQGLFLLPSSFLEIIFKFWHWYTIVAYDEAVIKLNNAEQQIEDLKMQLDDALTAEDMLVQLTERNLMLGEVCLNMDICCYNRYSLTPENRGDEN